MSRLSVSGLIIPETCAFEVVDAFKFHDPVFAEGARIARKYGMKMALTYLAATYANNMLAAITTTGLFMSLHSASPATTGANEILGSTESGYASGGYTGARKAITWAGPSNGVVVSNDTQTFGLLATFASGIPYFGIWTADGTGAGTYLCGGATSGLSGSIPSGSNVTFTSAITLTQAG